MTQAASIEILIGKLLGPPKPPAERGQGRKPKNEITLPGKEIGGFDLNDRYKSSRWR
jgi:hypothetical protein